MKEVRREGWKGGRKRKEKGKEKKRGVVVRYKFGPVKEIIDPSMELMTDLVNSLGKHKQLPGKDKGWRTQETPCIEEREQKLQPSIGCGKRHRTNI